MTERQKERDRFWEIWLRSRSNCIVPSHYSGAIIGLITTMKEQNIGICCAVGQVTLHEFEKRVTLSRVSSFLKNVVHVSDTGLSDIRQYLPILFWNTMHPLMTLNHKAHEREKKQSFTSPYLNSTFEPATLTFFCCDRGFCERLTRIHFNRPPG